MSNTELKELEKYIDTRFNPPSAFYGRNKIKLIILGQDPTVKNEKSRSTIKTVLNLNKKGSLKRYIKSICTGLDINLENVYATNYFKTFFIQPPTTKKERKILQELAPIYLEQLKKELSQFPEIPVITLGEPLLSVIVKQGQSSKVRDYWGYHSDWKNKQGNSFAKLDIQDNLLERTIFPFPHQPSINKEFYMLRKDSYLAYTKKEGCI